MHLKEQLKLETTYKIFTLQNYNRTMHHAIPKSEYFINPSFYRLHNSLQQRLKAKRRSSRIKTPKEFTQTAFRQILSAFHFMETVFRFCGFGKVVASYAEQIFGKLFAHLPKGLSPGLFAFAVFIRTFAFQMFLLTDG